MNIIDSIKLSQELIMCPSVTPNEAGALDVLEKHLKSIGFSVMRHICTQEGYPDVENLYASFGSGTPHLNFAGHLDVVPVGDAAAWKFPPFEATIVEDKLYGRGAADMKTGVACFVSALSSFIQQDFKGKISILVTMDEEGPAVNGIVKMLPLLAEKGEVFDDCLLGEPSCPDVFGSHYRIGRRGTMTTKLTIRGKQGHVAYPDKTDNPNTRLTNILHALSNHVLDEGNAFFPPSNLEITRLYCDNRAENVVPSHSEAWFNIRYNTEHNAASLQEWITKIVQQYAQDYDMEFIPNGDPFLSEKEGPLVKAIEQGVTNILGKAPIADTGGGTSDGRFIKDYCNIAEFGIVAATNHQVNEHVKLQDIYQLSACYLAILQQYFKEQ